MRREAREMFDALFGLVGFTDLEAMVVTDDLAKVIHEVFASFARRYKVIFDPKEPAEKILRKRTGARGSALVKLYQRGIKPPRTIIEVHWHRVKGGYVVHVTYDVDEYAKYIEFDRYELKVRKGVVELAKTGARELLRRFLGARGYLIDEDDLVMDYWGGIVVAADRDWKVHVLLPGTRLSTSISCRPLPLLKPKPIKMRDLVWRLFGKKLKDFTPEQLAVELIARKLTGESL